MTAAIVAPCRKSRYSARPIQLTTTTTDTPPAVESSTSCEPVGAIELGVLAISALVLIAPALKGIDIAGLFGFDFREVREKVVSLAEQQEQVIRVIVEQDVGARTERALTQAERGEVVDLPPRSP